MAVHVNTLSKYAFMTSRQHTRKDDVRLGWITAGMCGGNCDQCCSHVSLTGLIGFK